MPPSWSEWQANFVELIVDPARDGSASLGLAARGLAVYRNNYRVGLIGVLVHTYPVLEQLVGNDFLTGLAREYVKREPLRSGNVHHYGASFGDFLDGFEPARALPYLADVARVEWSAHRAYYAEDAEPLSPETLTEDPSASPPLHFDPSVSLVRSPWPVVATWQAHQPGSPEGFYIDLGQGGEDALIQRRAGRVTVEAIPRGIATLLEHLLAGDSLTIASEAALAADETFDPQAAKARLFNGEVTPASPWLPCTTSPVELPTGIESGAVVKQATRCTSSVRINK